MPGTHVVKVTLEICGRTIDSRSPKCEDIFISYQIQILMLEKKIFLYINKSKVYEMYMYLKYMHL